MKHKSQWLKHTITALIVSALIIGFLLLCAACYWRGFVDGRRVFLNKDINCSKTKKGQICKIMEAE